MGTSIKRARVALNFYQRSLSREANLQSVSPVVMKYAILLICIGVAAGQFPSFGAPQPQRFPSPFGQQAVKPFVPRPTPRPFTPIDSPRIKYTTPHEITIVRQYFDDQGNGGYSWGFQNSDGTEWQEKIYFKNAGDPEQILVKEGFYTYYDTDARLVRVSYRADENGFQLLEDTRILVAKA